MVSDWKLYDIQSVFQSETFIRVSSSQIDPELPAHIIPYYVPDMRLAIYVDHYPAEVIVDCMFEYGFYTLCVSLKRDVAYRQMMDYANTVYWTKTGRSGTTKLHEPKLFGDVGHDLESTVEMLIPPKEFALVDSDVSLQMPPTIYGWITPRSSTARKLLMIPNGILDAGYRGPLFAQVLNMTDEPIKIEAGDRLAQVIFQKRVPVNIEYTDHFWYPSERDSNGFGSTGR